MRVGRPAGWTRWIGRSAPATASPSATVRHRASPGRQLAACAGMHVVNDGLFVGLYPLLPLMAADLRLSFAEIGAIKTAYAGSAAIFQVPAGMAAERAGEHLLLALGTGWVGLGLVAMALAAGFWPLFALGLAAGLGGNVQHPVATSVVSRLFDRGRRSTAIGTLNFAGDVGKVLAPLLVGSVAVAGGWRGGLLALGALGAAFALLYLLVLPPPPRPETSGEAPAAGATGGSAGEAAAAQGWGISHPGAFALLSGIGVLDSAARGASLTFIPFLLAAKGFDAAAQSALLTVLFAAGAAGKFVCGPLGDRVGNVAAIVLTELVTAGGLLALLGAPAGLVLLALLPLGFVLNGTSSVLYATVAELVHASKRARGYGLYYTCSQLAAALAPIAYGVVADRAGLSAAFIAMAAVTGLIVPLALVTSRASKTGRA